MASTSTERKRAANVLMTCALDTTAGGVQVVFEDLIRWLERTGRQVHLIYPSPLANIRLVERANAWGRHAYHAPMPGVVRDNAFVSIPLFLAFLPIAILRLIRLIRQKQIDVINCHYLAPYFIHLVLAGRLTRVPVVISVHGADLDAYSAGNWQHRFLLRRVMGGADRIVACSAALAGQAARTFPSSRHKVSWVHNGLELSRYKGSGELTLLPKPFLLCVCRHVHKKGVDTLLQAFPRILAEAPDLSLVLVGDGPLLEEHKALAERLRVEHRVLFMGEVAHADVSPFFEECAVYVLPSRAEPFGVVLLEAAYYRKPIVCTRVGGVPEIITNAVDGLMVEPDDPARMADQIAALLRDPELAGRLGERAHETLVARFLWSDRIHDYIDVLEGSLRPSRDEDADGPATSGVASGRTGGSGDATFSERARK